MHLVMQYAYAYSGVGVNISKTGQLTQKQSRRTDSALDKKCTFFFFF